MKYTAQLITVVTVLQVHWSLALEKDIEVTCLDGQATTITEGGVVANCAFQGLTRTSTIAPWLFQLTNVLQAVNASNNHIKRVSLFPLLPRVLTLSLQHNSIREIDPGAFVGLENLQILDLSYNRISGEKLKGVLVGKKSGDEYEPLPVTILLLSHNDISSLEPKAFEHLQFLRDLHLDNNPLIVNDQFFATLRQLNELKMLNLAGAGLTSLPKDAFAGVKLTSLLLNGNQFTQVPDLTALGDHLRLLNMNQNPIDELDSTSFSGLRSLMEIQVSGMPNLKAIRAETFSNLENIRVISCSYNPELVEVDEFAFWNHKISKRSNLQEVYLNNNALPRLRRNILPWLKMKKVTLDGNRWVCDCRLHWLATYLRNRNNTVDRITELKCWEPVWLNGTQMVFWNIDTTSRHENYPCQDELERERLEQEQERKRMELELEKEQKRVELEREQEKQQPNETLQPSESDTKEGRIKFVHILIVGAVIILVILIVSIIGYNKYKNYRPIYHVEKMSSPNHNEMVYLKGTMAEKTQLVP